MSAESAVTRKAIVFSRAQVAIDGTSNGKSHAVSLGIAQRPKDVPVYRAEIYESEHYALQVAIPWYVSCVAAWHRLREKVDGRSSLPWGRI